MIFLGSGLVFYCFLLLFHCLDCAIVVDSLRFLCAGVFFCGSFCDLCAQVGVRECKFNCGARFDFLREFCDKKEVKFD